MGIAYRKADLQDLQVITELTLLLYDDNTFEGLLEENQGLLNKNSESMYLAFDGDKAIGFAHCSLRYDYVEGTNGGNIGYLEGIYVAPEYRKKGVAKELVGMCEQWAREMNCVEFASDCELDNNDSYNFHLKIGFKEANRIICFAKELK